MGFFGRSSKKESPLIIEFNQWGEASKTILNRWVNATENPFIKKCLLVFTTMSIRTISQCIHSIESAYQNKDIKKREYKSVIKKLKEHQKQDSPLSEYFMELCISHFLTYHILRFLDEHQDILIKQNITKESFLNQFYNALNGNDKNDWKGIYKNNNDIINKSHNVYIKYYSNTLYMLGIDEDNKIGLVIAKASFEVAYRDLMCELIDDTLNSYVNGI